ncbi:MAG: flagellar protein export ATPase FliI [Oscillospiraceae bacterium]|nr:flagellar protein export ATPase FliI [Oscillospiraceae bacterium]
MDFAKAKQAIRQCETISYRGKIDKVIGLTVEAVGLMAGIGEICKIYTVDGGYILSEVVGFRNDRAILIPYDNLCSVAPGSYVEAVKNVLEINVGSQLQGRILDGLGTPIDGLGAIENTVKYSVNGTPINPLARPRVTEPIYMGIKAIDSLLTCAKGQRMGIFSGSGVGKSTLLGMIAQNVQADINVIALIGERGREVKEFIEKDLGPEGMKRSVVVVATSDQPAMVRLKCAFVATAIAEYFKDCGKNVVLLMDSLTRFAMAQREIGLATGEPPVARGYTPSVYSLMPRLLERSGNFETGSITALYTVLVEGDDVNEPISDTVRGILDGHIVLSRSIAMRNHYPAIDILASISRIMNDIVSDDHLQMANKMRQYLSVYYQNFDLISIGAYKSGTNKALDEAISKIDKINEFLCQKKDTAFPFEKTLELMKQALA